MSLALETRPDAAAQAWCARFNEALAARDARRLAACFAADGHWRDVLGLGWDFRTWSGAAALGRALAAAGPASGFAPDPSRAAPRAVTRAGEPCHEALLRFDTPAGSGAAVLRMRQGDDRAWTLLTTLDAIRGHDEDSVRDAREEPPFERDFHGPNWLDRREATRRYEGREPAVLIVGGGHAGITAAARLGAIGLDALIVDRMARVGDNWRLRYHGLKLHNSLDSNHLPYMPFPRGWPRYIAKDKIANWLEHYVETMEIDFWTSTSFEGATRVGDHWQARLRLADGGMRIMRPRHIVMAASVSAVPNLPDIPGLDGFGGQVVHSGRFTDGAAWRGRPVLVFGTGTSAHDVAQDLHGNGAQVTMVQRSPTLIVNIEPSAQLYDEVFYGPGPSIEDRDLLNLSFPLPVMKQSHKLITARAREHDAALLAGLERVGFRLDFGEDGTGWPLKYRNRGGGYYFNVGCSELLVQREVGLIQYQDIAGFEATGARMADGTLQPAELIVLATGYKGQHHMVEQLFGVDVAARVGRVWGFEPDTQELRNMWTRTPERGLWFTGGSFAQCRAYSKYLALGILAEELGLTARSG